MWYCYSCSRAEQSRAANERRGLRRGEQKRSIQKGVRRPEDDMLAATIMEWVALSGTALARVLGSPNKARRGVEWIRETASSIFRPTEKLCYAFRVT